MWDYPRPPRLEPVSARIRVQFSDIMIAETTRALRILETSHPPTYYIPPEDVQPERLLPSAHHSMCEWKGHYFDVVVGPTRATRAAWSYPDPKPAYAALRNHVAFYAQLMDTCFVGEERVKAQPGDFYGGWITSKIVGPFKGAAGTWYW